MTANLQAAHAGRVDAGRVGEVTRSVGGFGAAAVTAVVEVVLGVGLLCLFMLAMAYDPLDRRFSARGKRIAERSKRLATAPSATPEGAYAILPTD
jgi:hypothetical protein